MRACVVDVRRTGTAEREAHAAMAHRLPLLLLLLLPSPSLASTAVAPTTDTMRGGPGFIGDAMTGRDDALGLRTPLMSLNISALTGAVSGLRTAHGLVDGGFAAGSWLGLHGSQGAHEARATATGVNVTHCHGASICVSRLVSIDGRQATIHDEYEPRPDGSVRWTTTVDTIERDPFRSIIGHSLQLGEPGGDSYWVPDAGDAGGKQEAAVLLRSQSRGRASPYPLPTLRACASSEKAVPAALRWSFSATGLPDGSLKSGQGGNICLLTWDQAFTSKICSSIAGEVAVMYRCSDSSSSQQQHARSCPHLANQLWNFDNSSGKLSNRVAGNYCLDSAGSGGSMLPCGAAAGWRAVPIHEPSSAGGLDVQLESLAHHGQCLSYTPTKPPPPPPPPYKPSDPLRMRQTGHAMMSYGYDSFLQNAGINASESKGRGSMPIPLCVISRGNASLAFVQSLNDTVLAAAMDLSSSGCELRRYNNRLGSAITTFVVHLVPTAGAGWRPTMKWTMDTFPRYFQPSSPQTRRATVSFGLGMYTCAGAEDLDLAQLKISGGNVLWDGHFYWPYQGLFLPNVTEWRSNKGVGEQLDCGLHWRHGDTANVSMIRDTMLQARAVNISVLSYFNFMYFGQNSVWPLHGPLPHERPDEFYNSSLYLARHLNDSVCLPFRRDWQASVGMDPQGSSWRRFLLDQIAAKVDALGDAFNGIVVDEPTAGADFNSARGDDVSWCGYECASQLVAWQRTATSVRATIPTKVMLTNQINVMRIDLMAEMDGVFTEARGTAAQHDSYVNAIGLLGMASPTIVWSEAEMFNEAPPDAIMQKQLLMNVMPMAPAAGSDHSVAPGNPVVDNIYAEYGALFKRLRGAQWYLDDVEPVHVHGDASSISTNAFVNVEMKQFVVVITGAGKNGTDSELTARLSRKVSLCSATHAAPASCLCESLRPAPSMLGQAWRGSSVRCTRALDGAWGCPTATTRGGFAMFACPL